MISTKINSKILIWIASILFFSISCGQNKQIKPKQNDMLPKEINLNPKITKIIDSIFIFKNGVKKLETVQVFDLNKCLLTHGNSKYFVNDTLNQTGTNTFDHNGNSIESNTILHFKNSSQNFTRKFDNYGNMTHATVKEGDKTSFFEYKNTYINNKLTETSAISKNSGRIIDKSSFEYDTKGNLIAESIKSSYLEAKNLYEYNNDNQVTLYQHIRNGEVDDRIIYHYNNKLLSKKEWFESISPNPMVTEYIYNDKNQLILEVEKQFAGKIEYKNYDSFNNWQIKEQYSGGELNRLTKRIFFDN